MIAWLRSLMPTPDAVRNNRWLRWLGPALLHPRLWHMSRRGLALGFALGIFFGLLIPIAQIPLSAAAAMVLRANLPVAMASTLVTNPATFGPVYYAAWRVGSAVLGEPESEPPNFDHASPVPDGAAPGNGAAVSALAAEPEDQSQLSWLGKFAQVGKPLMLGLVIFACTGGLLAYLLTTWFWVLRVRLRRKQRLSRTSGAARS